MRVYENIVNDETRHYTIRVWFARAAASPTIEQHTKALKKFTSAHFETVAGPMALAALIADTVADVNAVEVRYGDTIGGTNGCLIYNDWP